MPNVNHIIRSSNQHRCTGWNAEVETLVSGEIDCEDFKSKLLCHMDKPAIINVNIVNALSLYS